MTHVKSFCSNTGFDTTLASHLYPWRREGEPLVAFFRGHSSKILEQWHQNRGRDKQARLPALLRIHPARKPGLSLLISEVRELTDWLGGFQAWHYILPWFTFFFCDFMEGHTLPDENTWELHFMERACFWKVYHNTKCKDYEFGIIKLRDSQCKHVWPSPIKSFLRIQRNF